MHIPLSGSKETHSGVVAALAAFCCWGFLPLYFNFLGTWVSPWEMLVHRMLWAALLLAAFTVISGRWSRVRDVVRNKRLLLALCGSALLIFGNWGTFIWAVTHQQVLQSSLGYYINPLFNVLLGFCFFGERLRPLQIVAVALAAAGVLVSVIAFGKVPWLSLMLAVFFGGYGLIRKQTDVDSITGLLVEALLLLPLAVVWLVWLHANNRMTFMQISPEIDLLLIGAGVVTIVPLMFFATAARRLRLGTLGLFQYITPTAHLLTGVYLLGEKFTQSDAITFGCIWLGLILYTTDSWRLLRHPPTVV